MTTATQTQFISPLLLMAVANFRKRNPQNGLKSGGLEPFVQNGACIKDGTALDPGAVTGYSFLMQQSVFQFSVKCAEKTAVRRSAALCSYMFYYRKFLLSEELRIK